MSEYSDFVKRIAARYSAQALRATTPSAQKDFKETAEGLLRAAKELDRLTDITTAIPRPLGNVSELPAELLAELSSVKVDELEDQTVTVINAFGGVANIDEILVGLYRKFKIIQTRKFMLNKLYRMMRNEVLFGVAGRKGLYSTKPSEELPASAKEASEVEDDADIPFEDDDDAPVTPVKPKAKRRAEEGFSQGADFDDEIPF